MKKYVNIKAIIMCLIIVGLLIFTIVRIINRNKTEDVPKKNDYGDINVNTNTGVIEDKKLGDLTFTNTSMIEQDGVTTLETTITNNSKESKYVGSFTIYVKDRSDEVITELVGYVGSELAPSEQRIITSSITDDITSAYKIEYKENE